MSYDKIISLDEWLYDRKKSLNSTPAKRRPKNIERPILSRTWSERRAMARAVKKAWDDSIASGKLVKTENGYRLMDE